jgi:Uma2 family endonuclease
MNKNTKTLAPITEIKPLENGDRLTFTEFERRYDATTNLKKAELIEGVVYMPAALRFKSHSKPHSHLMGWLGYYEAATPGVELGDNPTVKIDGKNGPQPDAILRIEGGQSIINDDDYIEGAPELIAEVSASTVSYDLHKKFQLYLKHEVQEYLVWRVYDSEFDWFRLKEGNYIQLKPNQEGIICSEIFPCLWLDKQALLSGNLAQVLKVLQQGIATQEHTNFVAELAKIC